MAKLIVIEGLDGSGKETQAKELKQRLQADGHNVYNITFPNYSSVSSGPVKMYLEGGLGDNMDDISVYGASSLYSVDRFATYRNSLKELFDNEDNIIIADRYTSSNIIHQSSKIDDDEEREEYYEWLYDLEFNRLGIPREDLIVYLDVDIEESQKLMSNRYNGDDTRKDLHEKDKTYLLKCKDSAKKAIDYFNGIGHKWEVINCNDKKGIRSISDIADDVYRLVDSSLKLSS